MIQKRIITALRKADKWLIEFPLHSVGNEKKIQRIFAISASRTAQNKTILKEFSKGEFEINLNDDNFVNDAKIIVASHVILQRQGIKLHSFEKITKHWAELLNGAPSPLPAELNGFVTLLRHAGIDVPKAEQFRGKLPIPQKWLSMDRAILHEECRRIEDVTAFGRYPIFDKRIADVLAALSVSFAIEQDPVMVCTLLRACSCLKPVDYVTCKWSLNWLLDQQDLNGSFGFQLPTNFRDLNVINEESSEKISLTALAIWTLAEFKSPGFLYT